VFLDDGEMAVVTQAGVDVHRISRPRVTKNAAAHHVGSGDGGEGRLPHFMLKEIYEQPWAVRETVLGALGANPAASSSRNADRREGARGIERIVILACGTSWHAGSSASF
jgi:glucosamine--fructose-6-phosphate aminotransferase (isomerizing)